MLLHFFQFGWPGNHVQQNTCACFFDEAILQNNKNERYPTTGQADNIFIR